MGDRFLELKLAIDKADIPAIERFLTENDSANFNDICANGASALWWALTPPRGKEPNPDVIALLVNHKKRNGDFAINPAQTFYGVRPITYTTHLGLKNESATIQQAEKIYVAPRRDIANEGPLDAHDPKAARLARHNIRALYDEYIIIQNVALNPIAQENTLAEIQLFIDAQHQGYRWKQIKNGFAFCQRVKTPFAFEDDESTTLTLSQLLVLLWSAANEKNPLLLPVDSDKENAAGRKMAIVDCLFDINTAYGDDHPSCQGGAYNRLGIALSGMHNLVKANARTEVPIDGAEAQVYILGEFRSHLVELMEKNLALYWKVIRKIACLQADPNDEAAYLEFVNSKKEVIKRNLIADYNVKEDLINTFVGPLVGGYSAVTSENAEALEKKSIEISESSYPITTHKISFILTKLIEAFESLNIETSVFTGSPNIDETIQQAYAILTQALIRSNVLQQVFDQYQLKLADDLVLQFVTAWIEIPFNSSQEEAKSLKSLFPKSPRIEVINTKELDSIEVKKVEEIKAARLKVINAARKHLLYVQLKNYVPSLQLDKPKLAEWFQKLSTNKILDLLEPLVNDKNHDFSDPHHLLMALVEQAIKLGDRQGLPLIGLTFRGDDFRGCNFSHTQIKDTVFKDCDLRLVCGSGCELTNVSFENCTFGFPIDEMARKQPNSFTYFTRLSQYVLSDLDYAALANNLTEAEVNSANDVGNTPLFAVVSENNASLVRLLLDKGANTTVTNATGATPFTLAIHSYKYKALRVLLEYGDTEALVKAIQPTTADQFFYALKGIPKDHLATYFNSIAISSLSEWFGQSRQTLNYLYMKPLSTDEEKSCALALDKLENKQPLYNFIFRLSTASKRSLLRNLEKPISISLISTIESAIVNSVSDSVEQRILLDIFVRSTDGLGLPQVEFYKKVIECRAFVEYQLLSFKILKELFQYQPQFCKAFQERPDNFITELNYYLNLHRTLSESKAEFIPLIENASNVFQLEGLFELAMQFKLEHAPAGHTMLNEFLAKTTPENLLNYYKKCQKPTVRYQFLKQVAERIIGNNHHLLDVLEPAVLKRWLELKAVFKQMLDGVSVAERKEFYDQFFSRYLVDDHPETKKEFLRNLQIIDNVEHLSDALKAKIFENKDLTWENFVDLQLADNTNVISCYSQFFYPQGIVNTPILFEHALKTWQAKAENGELTLPDKWRHGGGVVHLINYINNGSFALLFQYVAIDKSYWLQASRKNAIYFTDQQYNFKNIVRYSNLGLAAIAPASKVKLEDMTPWIHARQEHLSDEFWKQYFTRSGMLEVIQNNATAQWIALVSDKEFVPYIGALGEDVVINPLVAELNTAPNDEQFNQRLRFIMSLTHRFQILEKYILESPDKLQRLLQAKILSDDDLVALLLHVLTSQPDAFAEHLYHLVEIRPDDITSPQAALARKFYGFLLNDIVTLKIFLNACHPDNQGKQLFFIALAILDGKTFGKKVTEYYSPLRTLVLEVFPDKMIFFTEPLKTNLLLEIINNDNIRLDHGTGFLKLFTISNICEHVFDAAFSKMPDFVIDELLKLKTEELVKLLLAETQQKLLEKLSKDRRTFPKFLKLLEKISPPEGLKPKTEESQKKLAKLKDEEPSEFTLGLLELISSQDALKPQIAALLHDKNNAEAIAQTIINDCNIANDDAKHKRQKLIHEPTVSVLPSLLDESAFRAKFIADSNDVEVTRHPLYCAFQQNPQLLTAYIKTWDLNQQRQFFIDRPVCSDQKIETAIQDLCEFSYEDFNQTRTIVVKLANVRARVKNCNENERIELNTTDELVRLLISVTRPSSSHRDRSDVLNAIDCVIGNAIDKSAPGLLQKRRQLNRLMVEEFPETMIPRARGRQKEVQQSKTKSFMALIFFDYIVTKMKTELPHEVFTQFTELQDNTMRDKSFTEKLDYLSRALTEKSYAYPSTSSAAFFQEVPAANLKLESIKETFDLIYNSSYFSSNIDKNQTKKTSPQQK